MFLSWTDWLPSISNQAPDLELISRYPQGRRRAPPVLFVHGAFAAAWCWEEHFLDYFAGRGYAAHALSLRGHGASGGWGELQRAGIRDYVNDLERTVAAFETPPVLVGHSMGGMVVQRYLERGDAPAVVLMASVPPTGLMDSSLRLLLGDPMLLGQLMMFQGNPGLVDVTTARRAIFSDHVPQAEVDRFKDYIQPESQRAIWELHTGLMPRRRHQPHCPMRVMGAADDRLIPEQAVHKTARFYGVEADIEPGMAHAMMLEPNWQRVADRVLAFLDDTLS